MIFYAGGHSMARFTTFVENHFVMLEINFPVLALSAVIPLAVGSLWYSPLLLANAWMKSADMTEDKIKGANMILIFGLTYVFSFFLAMLLQVLVIHQFHLGSILMDEPDFNDPNGVTRTTLNNFMELYGDRFRTFGHGAFHGVFTGLFFSLPVIAINALFERLGARYILINAGYWIVSLALMGGIICQFT